MQNHNLALISFIRQYGVSLLFGLFGIVFISIGLFQTFSAPVDEIIFDTATEEDIYVDVGGAVINPGVYPLRSNSRFKDAVIAAGGLSGDADREHLDKQVNMARVIVDGEKIYIPYEGELDIVENSARYVESPVELVGEEPENSGLVNLNTASEAQLDELPGVGPVTIEKIMNARPYASVEELLSKGVVGEATYGKIKDLVEVN